MDGLNDIATYFRVQQFLYHEARLIDEHRYDDWLSLWEEDAHYWIPCNEDDVDRTRHISLVNENLAGLQDRIFRLKGTANYAQQPASRTAHVLGNIELESGAGTDDIIVHSTLHVAASRKGRTDMVSGRIRHQLKIRGDSFGIRSKKVILVNNDDVFGNLTFLI